MPGDVQQDIDQRQSATLNDMSRQLQMLNQVVTGNGNPATGMIVRMDRIERTLNAFQQMYEADRKALQEEKEAASQDRKQLFYPVINSIISAIVGGIIAVVVTSIVK